MIGAIGSVAVLTELGVGRAVVECIHELQRRVKVIKLNVNGTYEISIESKSNRNVAATFLTTIGVRHSPLNTVQILKKKRLGRPGKSAVSRPGRRGGAMVPRGSFGPRGPWHCPC